METLRWILLGIAVVIIVAIYYFSRTRNNKEQLTSPLEAANDVPSFSAKDNTQTKADNDWVDGVGPIRVRDQSDTDQHQSVKSYHEEFSATKVSAAYDELPVEIEVDLDLDLNANQRISEEIPAESNTARINKVESPVPESPEDEPAEEISSTQLEPAEPIEAEIKAKIEENQVFVENSDSTDSTHTPNSTDSSQATGPDKAAIDDVISVYVLASEGEALIKGEKILSASYALQLEHGEMKIFHRHSETPERKILFSMANIMTPGWFDIENINDLETRGMSFFMQVNLVDHPARVLDDMLICAHQLATMLGGVLCNPKREPLDEAFTLFLRDKVKYLEKIKAQSV